ncbi:MAG: hypothetical protein AAB880_01825 [Patescibacteria group bacterium]
MENQTDLDQPVTRREFQEFASFAGETFATKQDLKEGLSANKEDVRRIVEKSEERIMESFRHVMTGNDAIAKEVKAMREEQAAHFGSHKRQDEEIVQVKRRLDKVEAHVGLI